VTLTFDFESGFLTFIQINFGLKLKFHLMFHMKFSISEKD